MVSVPSASAVIVIIVYTPMRHSDPRSNIPLTEVMSRISPDVGRRQCDHRLGSIRFRESTSRKTAAEKYCAASVAHAAPVNPRFKPDPLTAHTSPTTFTNPAHRKMRRGVFASCCPRQPPCAEVQNSTAGMAKARTRRYGAAAPTRSGEHPMTRSTSSAKTFSPTHVAPPNASARMVELANARRTVRLSPSAHARATIPVVVMDRKLKIWKTI